MDQLCTQMMEAISCHMSDSLMHMDKLSPAFTSQDKQLPSFLCNIVYFPVTILIIE